MNNAAQIGWVQIDKAGSLLADIETRPHSALQSIGTVDPASTNTTRDKHVSNNDIKALVDHTADMALHITAAQNTLLDGLAATLTAAELNFVDGVTSAIQPQIDGRALLAGSAAQAFSASTLTAATSVAVGGGTAITKMVVYSQSLDVASVAAASTSEQTFTVTGLTTADTVIVNKPSHSSGLGLVNARVSAADTLALTFMNVSAAPIDPGAETYTIVAIRS